MQISTAFLTLFCKCNIFHKPIAAYNFFSNEKEKDMRNQKLDYTPVPLV